MKHKKALAYAEKTERFTESGELHRSLAATVGFIGGIAGGLLQLIDLHHTHWMNILCAVGCGVSAGYWLNEVVTNFSNYMTIRSMGELADEYIDKQATNSSKPLDEKELNELKKITGME